MLPSLSMPCRLHPLTVCTQEAEQCHESFCRLCQSTLSAECVALSTHAFKGLSEAACSDMQGSVEVAKEVRFADKAVYFPWRPRCELTRHKGCWYFGQVPDLDSSK